MTRSDIKYNGPQSPLPFHFTMVKPRFVRLLSLLLEKYSKYRRDTDWPLQYNSWQKEDCEYGQEVGQLVSLVFRGETRQQVERVSQSVWWHYPRVPVIIRAPARLELELHHKYSTLYIK